MAKPTLCCPVDRSTTRGRLDDDPAGYGLFSRTMHWAIALLILALIALGLYASPIPRGTELRETLLSIHKSFGFVLLILVLVQLIWTRLSRVTHDDDGFQQWEVHAARAGHAMLYMVMLGMPLSGILMSQGGGRETGFFDLIVLPQVVPIDTTVPPREQYYYRLGVFLHDVIFQYALYLLIAVHLAGVVKHHFIDGDKSFVRRMWGLGKPAR